MVSVLVSEKNGLQGKSVSNICGNGNYWKGWRARLLQRSEKERVVVKNGGRAPAFEISAARYVLSEGAPARRLGQRLVRALRTKFREVWRVLL